MKPLEAWDIISANLANLYRMRAALYPDTKAFTEAETDAEVLCYQALKEMQERSNSNER